MTHYVIISIVQLLKYSMLIRAIGNVSEVKRMILANVQVNIDEKAIKIYIQQQLDRQMHETFLMIDIRKMAEITSMSVRFLEDEILSDPRMRVNERRKSRKRWWLYKQSVEVIKEIVDEW